MAPRLVNIQMARENIVRDARYIIMENRNSSFSSFDRLVTIQSHIWTTLGQNQVAMP